MLGRLLELFAAKEQVPEIPEADRVRLATCVILLEVAGADEEFSPEECERIIAVLRKRFDLSQEEAEDLIRVSQIRRSRSYDLWKFTHQLNTACTQDEKRRVLEEVWGVIYADGALDAHEDYLVHQLARLLNLTHPQLIEAKLRVLDRLHR